MVVGIGGVAQNKAMVVQGIGGVASEQGYGCSG